MEIFNQNAKKIIKKILELKKKKKIVLCHGVFDLIHPGHLDHFIEAKKLGDILVVTITTDKFIKKSIHNPFFNEIIRLNSLKQIKIIDFCFLVNEPTCVSVIQEIKPDYYCKGVEYKILKDDKKLKNEIKFLKKFNGKIRFVGGNVKSSSKIISEKLFCIEDEDFKEKLKKLNKINFNDQISKLKKLKPLIIGETILDEYINVKTKGISPKSNTLSYVETDKSIMPGGALATYKFVSSIAKKAKLISIINYNSYKKYKKQLGISNNILISKKFPNIIKSRIVEEIGNNALKKNLTINSFIEKKIDKKDEKKIIKKINLLGKHADIIIVQDFGHGLFSEKIIKNLQKFHKKISLNVQTNSLNYGFNIIGKKHHKAKIFCLDEKELQLFVGKKEFNYEKELYNLKKNLKSNCGYLTLGDKYSMLINNKNKIFKVPKINNKAIDTMGAGDVFHAMVSLLSIYSKDDFFNLFVGQIAGAHAVSYIGNSSYPKLSEITSTYNFYQNTIEK